MLNCLLNQYIYILVNSIAYKVCIHVGHQLNHFFQFNTISELHYYLDFPSPSKLGDGIKCRTIDEVVSRAFEKTSKLGERCVI